MSVLHSRVIFFDGRSVTVRELARAIGKRTAVDILMPQLSVFGRIWFKTNALNSKNWDGVTIHTTNLRRGWWRPGIWSERKKLINIIQKLTLDQKNPLIIYSTPQYADLAERIEGCQQLYYVTDNFRSQAGQGDFGSIAKLEERLARKVNLVCANSPRTVEFFKNTVGIDEQKIQLINNAVRDENLLNAALKTPECAPPELTSVPRPWALLLGNLGSNIDWKYLNHVVEGTPWLHWVAVGPAEEACVTIEDEEIRNKLINSNKNFIAIGWRPPESLFKYARACDVAVLPYRGSEPTKSGSSTRSYEHFAASRPMVASNGVDELNERSQIVKICDSSAKMIEALLDLRNNNFTDGFEEARWKFASQNTLSVRVEMIFSRLQELGEKKS